MSEKISLVVRYSNGQTNTFFNVLDKNYTPDEFNTLIKLINQRQNYNIENYKIFDALVISENKV